VRTDMSEKLTRAADVPQEVIEHADSKRRQKRAASSGDRDPTAKEVERRQLEERVASFEAVLRAARSDEFPTALGKAVETARRERLSTEAMHAILLHGFKLAPAGVSGAFIVKHFKASSKDRSSWKPSEIAAAVRALAAALKERIGEISSLGPLLHGALAALYDEVKAQPKPATDLKPADDVVGALVDLHVVVWSDGRPPLDGLPNTDVSKIVERFVQWISEMPPRPEVRAIEGQRLFGFDVVVPHRARVDGAPAKPINIPLNPSLDETPAPTPSVEGVLHQGAKPPAAVEASKSDAKAVPQAAADRLTREGEVGQLKRELAELEARLERSEHARDQLRAERNRARLDIAEASALNAAIAKRLELAIAHGEELEEEVARLRVAEADLAVVRETLAVERKAKAEIAAQLAAAEAAIETAKRNEFDRGRREGWDAAAHQCVEPLEQIEVSAAPYTDDGGMFIRQMAKSLISYFRKGEENA
jgi:hypothetical protein